MKRRREFSVAESSLFDSEWMLEHPGGQFKIEFRNDGFNHFIWLQLQQIDYGCSACGSFHHGNLIGLEAIHLSTVGKEQEV